MDNIENSHKPKYFEYQFFIILHKKLRWVKKYAEYIANKEQLTKETGFNLTDKEIIDRQFLNNLKSFWKEENNECKEMLRIMSHKNTEGATPGVSW